MARAFPVTRALAVVAAASLSLTACGSEKKEDAAAPAASASASSSAGDGVLKFGTLLPETGSLQVLGPPEIAAVKLAIKDINAAGGVLGKDVAVEYADSGDTKTNIARQSVDRLLDANVDAIIGAASSAVTLLVAEHITGNGVLQISPANTSTKLTDFNDKGLYFRTAPSDVFQGRVVGQTAAEDGAETLGILALQDAYGTSLADQAEKAFTDAGGEVVAKNIYNPTASEFASEVGKIKAANPDAIALIGFEESSKIIEEMVKQGILPLSKSPKRSMYFVDGNLSNTYSVATGTLEGVKGTLPGAKPSDELKSKLKEIDADLVDFSYAGEAYDAVVLVALAAEVADSDEGKAIAAKMQEVSTGGEKCETFADCVELAKDGKDFDYEGLSGPVEFDELGNPTVASMGVYQYGADNKYSPLKYAKGPIAGGTTSTPASANPAATSAATPAATDASSSEDEDAEATSSPSATATP